MTKYLLATIMLPLLLFAQSLPAFAENAQPAASQKSLLIVELQTASALSASDEFVEVYNPNDADFDVTGWRIEYRTAANNQESGWRTKATVSCPATEAHSCALIVPAHGRLLFTSYGVPEIEGVTVHFAAGFSGGGGQVRLMRPESTVAEDMVGYGLATTAEGDTPAAAPDKGQSLGRTMLEGVYTDTNKNADDFTVDPTPTPASDATDQQSPLPPPSANAPPAAEQEQEAAAYLPVIITELLPDPASPQQDSNDEFIELFNPGSIALNLKNYTLQSGSNYRYSYRLPELVVAPGGYIAIRAEQSRLSLSNSGTSVRILDPNQTVLDEVSNYGKALPGQSWMREDDDVWQWSATPTPGTINKLDQAPPKVLAATTTAKKAAASSTKPKAAAAPKTTKPKADPKTIAAVAKTPEQPPQNGLPLNYLVLAGVGTIAVGYAAFEYRREIGGVASRVWGALRGRGQT